MINIPGNKVITDSDALMGIIHKEDLLHKQSLAILDFIENNEIVLIIPYPIVLEAATTLSRGRILRPDLSAKLLRYCLEADKDQSFNPEVAELVAGFYNPKTSKKNTPFDHYVLALAKKNNIKYIFSFDSFYKKNGLILMEDLLDKESI